MHKNVFLIGFMGSGKSTIGKKIATELGYSFIDLDKEVEHHAQCSISDIFKYLGESTFREMESKCLKSMEGIGAYVMATGGGTPCYFDNMNYIKQQGISVYISMDEKSIFSRLQHAKNVRPSIQGKSDAELAEFIHEQYAKRREIYEQADIIVNGLSFSVPNLIKEIKSLSV